MILDDIELIRQVLASASRAKLPRAEEAMDALQEINTAMIALKELDVLMRQKESDNG